MKYMRFIVTTLGLLCETPGLGTRVCLAEAYVTYQKSPCNVVHWTHMLEGKIVVEGRDAKPLDIESPFVFEHDLPSNHRIVHPYDDEATDRQPDRLTIYVDRENIFLNAFCM